MNRKLSYSVRIDRVSPSHIFLSVFTQMVPKEHDHVEVTRAKAGDLVLTNDEAGKFIKHTMPHIISALPDVDREELYELTGIVV